jgi:hypothetical protein
MMLLAQSLSNLLFGLDEALLEDIPMGLFTDKLPIVLSQALKKTLVQFYERHDLQGMSVEEIPYAVVMLVSLRSIPWFTFMAPDIDLLLDSLRSNLALRRCE